MAIVYLDPCGDNYSTTELVARGWVTTASPTINASTGRRAGPSLRMTGGTMRHGRFVPKRATYYAGWAQQWSALPATNQPLFLVYEWATEHMRITANTDGSITAFRGGVSSLGSSSAGALASGSFQFVEVQFTIDDAAGVVLVKVDGSTVLNLTTQDTRNVGDEGLISYIEWRNPGTITNDKDDLYILDGSGSVNNTFLGDVAVLARTANGNGASSQLTGSDADSVDNYLLVDETAPSMSDYVGTSTVDTKDTYGMQNIGGEGTPIAVQVALYGAKADTGQSRLVQARARSVGSEVGNGGGYLGRSSLYQFGVYDVDPNGNIAWTRPAFDGIEVGGRLVS